MNKDCHGVVVSVVVKIKYYIVVTVLLCFVCVSLLKCCQLFNQRTDVTAQIRTIHSFRWCF